MGYIFAIKVAVLIFPILAFIFTLPYILTQYHKYGSVSLYRSVIIFSFIFYMICIYFLVILPLPDVADVGTQRFINLRPFNFVKDFMKESVLDVGDFSTYLPAMKQPCFYVVLFNVFMMVPFGIYLRYYFQCGFKKTVILSLLLSIFFEFTQYTGIYFMYPGSYRLCDVDDLIQNTAGGMLGYAVAGLAMKLLPSRDRIDRRAYDRGERVSGFRRFLMFMIDMLLLLINTTIIFAYSGFQYAYPVTFFVLYILIPLVTHGRTIGSWIVNMKMDCPNKWGVRIVIRNIIIAVYYNIMPYAFLKLLGYTSHKNDVGLNLSGLAVILFGLVLFASYMVQPIIVWISGRAYYDKMMKVSFVSTVKRKNTIRSSMEAEASMITDQNDGALSDDEFP
ncbi:MAG: VanZ family protein [Coprococcus sp.]|nr:VanZ family protein [Coprococcus sp.]